MKLLFIICILFFTQMYVPAAGTDMKFIREHFYMAVEDEDALDRLENYIHSKYSTDPSTYPPVILAYKGGVEALRAKHVFSPFSKFSHLISSLELLDEAVLKMPQDLEVRFIRYSILDNIPSFLGYGTERESDKEIVIRELLKNDFSSIDIKTQKGLIDYLINSGSLTKQEELMLTNKCIAFRDE